MKLEPKDWTGISSWTVDCIKYTYPYRGDAASGECAHYLSSSTRSRYINTVTHSVYTQFLVQLTIIQTIVRYLRNDPSLLVLSFLYFSFSFPSASCLGEFLLLLFILLMMFSFFPILSILPLASIYYFHAFLLLLCIFLSEVYCNLPFVLYVISFLWGFYFYIVLSYSFLLHNMNLDFLFLQYLSSFLPSVLFFISLNFYYSLPVPV